MCTNYVPSAKAAYLEARLGELAVPDVAALTPSAEVYPGYSAPVVLRRGGTNERSAALRLAQFGLVPHWCTDAAQARDISRKTYNARSETAASKPSFRTAWAARQWVLVPMQCFFEPSWEDAAVNGGRPTRWRIARADGQPFAVAGLWDRWTDPTTGGVQGSFTVLTVNADGHAVMGRMHRPDEEKRMPVIVPPAHYADWLQASPQQAVELMRAAPAEDLVAAAAPLDRAAPVEPNLSLF
ncbi:MAG: SOS response-associated peptidase [Burkholderiaceae bacterium]|nr:SOS response-associated peptidase [Burkholderiaceae bacterium]